MTKDAFSNLLAGILAICAVVVTSLWIRRELIAPAEQVSEIRIVDNWREFADGGQQLGAPGASVEIIVFSDFQCPYCGSLARRLDTLVANMPGQLSLRFRHYPMRNLHTLAPDAAMAAECASNQGRFKQYHDALFAKQDSIGSVPWTRFAFRAGVPDTNAFSSCMRDSTTVPRIQADIEAGVALGVTGTPAVLVNDQFHRGAPTLARLQELVRAASGAEPRTSKEEASAASPRQQASRTGDASCTAQREEGAGAALNLAELESQFGRAAAARILLHQVCIGMRRDMVRSAWGAPLTMNVLTRDGVKLAEWRYRTQVVFLASDTVTDIR